MKKLMSIASAMLCVTALASLDPSATSLTSGVVGYTSKEAAQGKFIIMGAQFESVKDGSMKINDLVTGLTGVDYDDANVWKTTAAQIQVPSAGGYTIYYYLNDGYYEDESGAEAYKPGWCDVGGNLVDDEFTAGVAQWLKSVQDSASALVSGGVSDAAKVDVSCLVGFALRANAFPVITTLNTAAIASADIIGVDYDDANVWKTTAPQIQVPSAGGYTIYYYLNDGYYEDENGAEAYKPGWCDVGGNLVSEVIPAAQGFWTKGVQGAFTMTFTK